MRSAFVRRAGRLCVSIEVQAWPRPRRARRPSCPRRLLRRPPPSSSSLSLAAAGLALESSGEGALRRPSRLFDRPRGGRAGASIPCRSGAAPDKDDRWIDRPTDLDNTYTNRRRRSIGVVVLAEISQSAENTPTTSRCCSFQRERARASARAGDASTMVCPVPLSPPHRSIHPWHRQCSNTHAFNRPMHRSPSRHVSYRFQSSSSCLRRGYDTAASS